MVGILVVSHGKTAEGLLDSLKMFFGENIEAIDYLSLQMEMSVEGFSEMMDQKIEQLDDGDGVLILADLKGGTPANQAMMRISEKVKVIFGVNLPILMELLASRMADNVDVDYLVSAGRESISSSDEIMNDTSEEENFF